MMRVLGRHAPHSRHPLEEGSLPLETDLYKESFDICAGVHFHIIYRSILKTVHGCISLSVQGSIIISMSVRWI